MRRFSVSLVMILFLTACAAPTQPVNPAEPESHAPILDGALATSLLVTQSKNGSEGNILFPLDPNTGKPLPNYSPIPLGETFFSAFSPDRQRLAVVSFSTKSTYDGSLLLIDIPTWTSQPVNISLSGWVSSMVFSPDGKQLAIAHGETSYKLTLVDIEREKIRAQKQLDTFIPHLKFTIDGKDLMLYRPTLDPSNRVTAGSPQVLLLTASDLTPLWSAELENIKDGIFPRDETIDPSTLYSSGQGFYRNPGLVFAPQKDLLYIVHADEDRLTTVDFAAHQVKTVNIQTQLSWFDQILSLTAGTAHAKVANGTSKQAVISPDGQFLYVMGMANSASQDTNGNWQAEQTILGLDILEADSGNRIEHFDTDTTELSLSPDGRFLYLRNWGSYQLDPPWTDIFDTSTRQFIAHKPEISGMPAFLVNGKTLLVSTYSQSDTSNEMTVLEPDGSSVLSKWTGSEYVWWLTTP